MAVALLPMDHLVAARNLINELVAGEHLEVRRPDLVGRDLAQLVTELQRPPSGRELEQWLEQHRLVTECYAGAPLLDQLLGRHFSAALAAAPVVLREARNPELERAIREAPDQPELYLVYSDWLQEQSDPLGELIGLGVLAEAGGAAEKDRFERYLKLHEGRFLGALARQVPDRIKLRWRHGLVGSIQVTGKLELASWEQLLRVRVCELLEAIETEEAWSEETATVIAAAAPRSLRTLTLAGCDGALPAALLQRELETLVLIGDRLTLGPGSIPATLERLELRVRHLARAAELAPGERLRWPLRELHLDLSAEAAAFLAAVELPRLEGLTLDLLGAPTSQLLVNLLRTVELPAIQRLTIQSGQLDQQALLTLPRLPFAAQLSSLALLGLELSDRAMPAIVRELSGLSSLAVVDLSNNELSGEGLEAARGLAPQILSRRQERPGSAAHQRLRRFAGSRLQAAEQIVDPRRWSDAGISPDGTLLWARYRGEEPYELFVARDLRRYGCNCPSSIRPCKHVVALALVAERHGLQEGPSGGVEHRVRQLTWSELFNADVPWLVPDPPQPEE